MDLKAIQEAIRTLWVLPASGLADGAVYFARQDGVTPAPGCITIDLGGPVFIGGDQVFQSFDEDADPGEEIVMSASGPRELVATLEAISSSASATDTAVDARSLLSKIAASLHHRLTARPALNAAGLGVLKIDEVRSVPAIHRAGWEGRAMLEVTFCVTETAEARIGYIETAEITGTVDGVSQPPYTLIIED